LRVKRDKQLLSRMSAFYDCLGRELLQGHYGEPGLHFTSIIQITISPLLRHIKHHRPLTGIKFIHWSLLPILKWSDNLPYSATCTVSNLFLLCEEVVRTSN
jgi:hypothetical protein